MTKKRIPRILLAFVFALQSLVIFAWNPKSIQEYFDKGQELYASGEHQNAIEQFEKVLLALEQSPNAVLEARTYARLGSSMAYSNIDEALRILKKAYELSISVDDPEAILGASTAISEIHSLRGQQKLAMPYRLLVVKYNLLIKDWYNYSNALSMTGNDYILLNQLDSAKWYIEKGLHIKDSLKIEKNLFLNYNHLAFLYEARNDTERSIEYHLKCIKILEENKDSAQMVPQFNNISRVFLAQGNLDRAEEYCKKALSFSDQLGLYFSKAGTLSLSARIRMMQGKTQEALALYKESLKINQELKIKRAIIMNLMNIGNFHLQNQSHEMAEEYFLQALPSIEERDIPSEVIDVRLSMAKVKMIQGKMLEAGSLLQKAEAKLEKINDQKIWLRFYNLKSDFLEEDRKFQEALFFGQKAKSLRDSLFNLEKSARIHELEEKYERTKKEKKIALLNAENNLKDITLIQSQRKNLLVVIALVLSGLALLLLLYFNRLRRDASKQLEEKNTFILQALTEKEVLLKEIHHRVKNNLQIVSSLLSLQSKHIDDPKALDALQEGQNRVKSMAIIHSDLYQAENLKGISVKKYIEKLSNSLFKSYNINPDKIQLKHEIEALQLDVDTIIPLGLILNELITNALKYAFPENNSGTVVVTLKREQDYLLLEVMDNGIGLNKGYHIEQTNEGFGFKLINTFAAKLKAQFEVLNKDGLSVRLLIHKFKLA